MFESLVAMFVGGKNCLREEHLGVAIVSISVSPIHNCHFSVIVWVFHKHTKVAILALLPTLYSITFAISFFICNIWF